MADEADLAPPPGEAETDAEMETDALDAPYEQLDAGGLSPLQRAVLAGDVEKVDQLLGQGADPNRVVVSADGRLGTALMSAVTLTDPGTRLAVVTELVNAGADPNRLMDGGSNPPLRYLLENVEPGAGDSVNEVIRLLMAHGARLDSGLTALAQERSLFGLVYEYKRRHAVATPIEEPTRAGCCLLPLAVIATLVGVVLFVIGQYRGWFNR